jgi:hypothetical protein
MENAIRPSAIGKKNFLFIGHPDAGDRSAICRWASQNRPLMGMSKPATPGTADR